MNEYTASQRSNRYCGSKIKKESQEKVICQILLQIGEIEIKTPVRLDYFFYEKNRRRDLDNISGFAHKVIQDALVKCGILKDDGWDEIVGFSDSFAVDAENPRIEVTITEV